MALEKIRFCIPELGDGIGPLPQSLHCVIYPSSKRLKLELLAVLLWDQTYFNIYIIENWGT